MAANRVSLYRKMLLSRRFEDAVSKIWRDGRISAEMHLGIGEEGIVAGVVDHLVDGDAMALDHRGTPPLVMRGVGLAPLLAELMGLESGLCRGMGGHMHLFAPEILAASSGIVGASGPAACGFALSHQHLRPGRVAVAFFGEAAMNQGMLMESINLAAAWTLPVLFVCKDNGMGITTPSARTTGGDLLERARGLGAHASSVDGSDVLAVWRQAEAAVTRARRGGGPSFLHATCVRPEGHFLGDPLLRITRSPLTEMKDRIGPLTRSVAGKGAGIGRKAAGLGSIASVVARMAGTRFGAASDPVRRLRPELPIDDAELDALEGEIEAEVTAAVDSVLTDAEAAS